MTITDHYDEAPPCKCAAGLPSTHPPLIIREGDERRLYHIAIGAMLRSPRFAGGLLDELSRANVCPDELAPLQVVGLGSSVVCCETDAVGTRRHRVEIVAPELEDAAHGRVSVLSDLGAALIGLAPGQTILWRDRLGGVREFLVVDVEPRESPSSPASSSIA